MSEEQLEAERILRKTERMIDVSEGTVPLEQVTQEELDELFWDIVNAVHRPDPAGPWIP